VEITSSLTIGVESNTCQIKGAVLRYKNKVISIKTFIQNKPSIDLKAFYIKNNVTVSHLDTKDVLIRQINLPKISKQNFNTSITFQIESTLMHPIEEAVVESKKIAKTKSSICFSTFIAKKNVIESKLNELKEFRLTPQILTSVQNAISEVTSYLSNFEGLLAFVSQNHTLLLFEKDPKLISYKFCNIGSQDFDKGGHALLSSVKKWQEEIAFLVEQLQEEFIDVSKKVLVIGSVFKNKDFFLLLSKQKNFNIELPCLKDLPISDDEFHDFCLPIGLALHATVKNKNQINFTKKNLSFYFLKKPLLFFYVISLVLSVFIFLYAQFNFSKKQEALSKTAQNFLSIKEDELKIETKTVCENLDFDELIKKLRSDEGIYNYPYKLKPSDQNLSYIFKWMEQQNLLNAIEIEKIHYFHDQYPNKKSPKKPYKSRIEMTCKLQNPEFAKVFEEKLHEDKIIVLQDKDFQINRLKDKLLVSFTIKGR
jgi:hypothetical protein